MLITFVRRNERLLILVGLASIALVVAFDIYLDIKEGLPFDHLLHETFILGFCLVLTLFQARVITRQRERLTVSEKEIKSLTLSRKEFQRKSMRFSSEFADAVSQQFMDWNLTEGERDVALLLIKGRSMKEIAEDRKSKEATVRQQATAIYKKANLEGRQELTAFFLEDLFSPLTTEKS